MLGVVASEGDDHLKKILTAGVMLATMSGVALAADLPSRVAPPVYAPPPIPVFTWSGAYFGINAGYAFDHEGKYSVTQVNANGIATGQRPGAAKVSSDGFTGGGQIGYNFQLPGFGGGFGGPGSGIVFGIEADAAYTDLNRNRSFAAPNALQFPTSTTNFRSGLDFLGTVRGRVGYAFGQFLVYGTGGFAYGGVDNRVVGLTGNTVSVSGSRDRIETGYAYGGGIEYALPTSSFLNFFKSSAVTVKAEYLHYDLGRTSIALTGAGTNPRYVARVSNDGDLARIGLNYKFGSY